MDFHRKREDRGGGEADQKLVPPTVSTSPQIVQSIGNSVHTSSIPVNKQSNQTKMEPVNSSVQCNDSTSNPSVTDDGGHTKESRSPSAGRRWGCPHQIGETEDGQAANFLTSFRQEYYNNFPSNIIRNICFPSSRRGDRLGRKFSQS